VDDLAISDVAERTGLTAATIRMWEQRYGAPAPRRTSAGYRRYSEDDVDLLRRVVALRADGLSVPAALERAGEATGTYRASLFGAILDEPVRPQSLSQAALLGISRAIEDETLARGAGPVIIAAFQRERHYRAAEHRYRRLAGGADACAVFADFDAPGGGEGEPLRVPILPRDALGNEWAVIVDAPGYATCLLGWETPRRAGGERRFEALWTLDPVVVRRAALAGAAIAGERAPAVGERLEALLRDRPLALESPSPGLTALTNRIVNYLDA
jgi:MerR family transcriptional regulator, light-induced transcriptional regulator